MFEKMWYQILSGLGVIISTGIFIVYGFTWAENSGGNNFIVSLLGINFAVYFYSSLKRSESR